jgi:hypothetical protein
MYFFIESRHNTTINNILLHGWRNRRWGVAWTLWIREVTSHTPHSFHQYTTFGKHSLPRGDVTRDNAMVTTQQQTTLAALRNNTGKHDDRQEATGNGVKSRRTSLISQLRDSMWLVSTVRIKKSPSTAVASESGTWRIPIVWPVVTSVDREITESSEVHCYWVV